MTSPKPARQRRSPLRRTILACLALAIAGLAAGVAAGVYVITEVGRAPRIWAPYLERRAAEHDPLITGAAGLAARWLLAVDRLPAHAHLPWPRFAGANRRLLAPRLPAEADPAHLRVVSTTAGLAHAFATARPGDVIELMPGQYRVTGYGLHADRPGTARAPITVQALHLGDAVIESDTVQAINVSAPYWHFINLDIHGVCTDDTGCEHAFHIVGGAQHILLRNLRLVNFNAQIKINRQGGRFPDHGRIERVTLIDTHPRNTTNPVTPIDLDDASHWRITGSLIADFVKANDQAAYGGYAKGDGSDNVFRRNVVLCAWRLRGFPGVRVGLSFGGGGTVPKLRRDYGRTPFEQHASTMADNLIAFCSDAGIYLNRAADSRIVHNTLLDTAGIDARFPETSARIEDNIVDGPIHARHGALITAMQGNLFPPLLGLFVGYHPQRALFADPARLDLRWRHGPPALQPARPGHRDLCGTRRAALSPPGAFISFAACLKPAPR